MYMTRFPAKLLLKLRFRVNYRVFLVPVADEAAPFTVHWPLWIVPEPL